MIRNNTRNLIVLSMCVLGLTVFCMPTVNAQVALRNSPIVPEKDQAYLGDGKVEELPREIKAQGDFAALYDAVDKEDSLRLKQLLDAGADINDVDEDGLTVLMYAVVDKKKKIIPQLLQAGADVNASVEDGFTILMNECKEGRADTVKQLLKTNVDVNVADKDGLTALMYASDQGNAAIVKQLLKAGANVNVADKNGWTPLMYANSKSKGAVKQLLKAGANVNAGDKDGDTVLIQAGYQGNTDIVKLLLKAGANVNIADKDGITALMAAVKGAYNGRQLWLKGTDDSSLEVARLLLKAGADVNVPNKEGKTSLELAYGADMIKLLLNAGAQIRKGDELSTYSYIGDTEKVKELLATGVDINAKDSLGETALMRASNGGHADTVQTLLQAGADVHAKDEKGYTVMWTARGENVKKLLLEAGAEPIASDPEDISCENVDTSVVNKKMLKKVLASLKEMEKMVLKSWSPDVYSDFGGGGPYPDLFYYDDPYANPDGMGIRVEHKDGGENLVIYGPFPKLIMHQCVMPVKENASAAFCCAVHELDPKYEVRQYSLSFP